MKFIVHEDPARRNEANYIARVDLSPFGFDGEVEQVWLRSLGDGSFELCCIPFRAYGMALGDVVTVSEGEATVTSVIRGSGNRVLRVLLAPDSAAQVSASEVKREIDDSGLINEWSGDRHVAIDVPPLVDVSALIGLLVRGEKDSLMFWEWGDALNFSQS